MRTLVQRLAVFDAVTAGFTTLATVPSGRVFRVRGVHLGRDTANSVQVVTGLMFGAHAPAVDVLRIVTGSGVVRLDAVGDWDIPAGGTIYVNCNGAVLLRAWWSGWNLPV